MSEETIMSLIRKLSWGIVIQRRRLRSLLLSAAPDAWAADDSATELAKKTQNPIADLISAPFENDFNFNTGKKDATVYVLPCGARTADHNVGLEETL